MDCECLYNFLEYILWFIAKQTLPKLVWELYTWHVSMFWISWHAHGVNIEGWLHIHSLSSWCSINFEWFEVMQESRLMFLFRTNTSPLSATCVTSGGSLQSALYLGNVMSVCWQGVPSACCCRLMTHLGWAYTSLLFHACLYTTTLRCNAAFSLTQWQE